MHVSLVRDPVEIRWRDNVLSVVGMFHCEYLLHAKGIHSLAIAQLLPQFIECLMRPIHTGGITVPQGNRRLGGLREFICCVYSVYELYYLITERV